MQLLIVEDVNLLSRIFKLEKWGKLISFWLLADILPHPQDLS